MIHAPLIDNFGRPITYLRLAVTDRCNLRCFYCMPAEGINYLPKKELLTYEEMERLVTVACELGIKKVRITGGEPFVRKEMIYFLERLSGTRGLEELHLTTNGVYTAAYIDRLKNLGIASVNLSLDTLDKERFKQITYRDEFDHVMKSFHLLLAAAIPVKVNMVVMEGKNTSDLLPMAELTHQHPISVRFIEEMPFNGGTPHQQRLKWDHKRILGALKETHPDLIKIADPDSSTAYHYQIPGYQGTIGIIAAYTRTFCGSCNRVRVTSQGLLKTCLYDKGALNIKELLRTGYSDEAIKNALCHAITHRHKDGHSAEASRGQHQIHESMSTIGG